MQDLAGATALERSRRSRKYVLLGGAVALSALAYQAYSSGIYGRSRSYLVRLRTALQRYSEALATGGEICTTVLRDLQLFLESGRDDVPPSLRQVSKLLQSPEFTSVASSTVEAVYRGVAGPAAAIADGSHSSQPQQGNVDKILEALLSDRGHSLVSVAVSMGAKNMVAAYMDAGAQRPGNGAAAPAEPDFSDKLFGFLSTPAGQQLAVMGVAAFATNGMRVYMDKSLDVNFYEDLFSSMAKPAHLNAVKQCVSVFARDVVAAYLHNGSRSSSVAALEQATQLREESGEVVAGRQLAGDAAGRAAAAADGEAGASAAESLCTSPASSSGDGAPTPKQRQRPDDLDSDSLLHARLAPGKAAAAQRTAGGQAGNAEWIAAVSKEWLNVSRDPAGRQAMATVVGSATREVVAGVSSVVADRFTSAWFLLVLLLGAATALLAAALLRSASGLLLQQAG